MKSLPETKHLTKTYIINIRDGFSTSITVPHAWLPDFEKPDTLLFMTLDQNDGAFHQAAFTGVTSFYLNIVSIEKAE